MICKNCGNKIKEGSNFCSSCGLEIEVISETKKEKFEVAVDKKTDTSKIVIDQIVTFISVIIGFIIGKYLGLGLFIFIFAFLIGQWFPKWYMKRDKINITLVKLIVWSNVLTWLLPPLGIMIGFATLEFGNYFPENSKKYKTIAIIGIVASFFNAFAGILMNI